MIVWESHAVMALGYHCRKLHECQYGGGGQVSGSGMTKVYVSYAWGPEKEADPDRKVVDRLGEALKAAELELLWDIKRAGYGKSIWAFMDEIGSADNIVVVLSDAYLHSPNCLYELRAIWKNNDVHRRVHPIVLQGTALYDPFAWVRHLKYWEEKEEELDAELKTIRGAKAGYTRSALNDYHDFRDMLDEQLALFSDMNTLSEGGHLDTDFAEIIERIKRQETESGTSLRVLEGETPGPQRMEAEANAEWEARLEREITDVLARAHEFRSKMAEKLGLHHSSDASAVARGLLCRHTQEVVEQVLVPGTRELLREGNGLSATKGRTLWHEANAVFCWLCLRVANGDVLASGESLPMLTSCELFSVEAHVARATPRPASLKWTPGTPEVRGRGAVLADGEGGWAPEARYHQLLVRLWNLVFPGLAHGSKQPGTAALDPLTKGELEKLKGELASLKDTDFARFRAYYLVLKESGRDPDLEQALKKLGSDFPGLAVVIYHAGAGEAALLVPESRFVAAVRRFLEIEQEVLA